LKELQATCSQLKVLDTLVPALFGDSATNLDDFFHVYLFLKLEQEFLLSHKRLKTLRAYEIGNRRFCLGDYDDMLLMRNFRFNLTNFQKLMQLLALPPQMKTSWRDAFNADEGLAILLYRLSNKTDFYQMASMFGRARAAICRIFNTMLERVYDECAHHVKNLPEQYIEQNAMTFSELVHSKLQLESVNVWGFIDGTLRPIARPGVGQQLFYDGHHKQHGVAYQCIVAPNGIILQMYGPAEGRRHDSQIMRQSGISDFCVSLYDDQQVSLIGDNGYALEGWLLKPYRKRARIADPLKAELSRRLSSVRIVVEHAFAVVTNKFRFMHDDKEKSILKSTPAKQFLVATFLTNCVTCCEAGNLISSIFNANHSTIPTLEEYFAIVNQ